MPEETPPKTMSEPSESEALLIEKLVDSPDVALTAEELKTAAQTRRMAGEAARYRRQLRAAERELAEHRAFTATAKEFLKLLNGRQS